MLERIVGRVRRNLVAIVIAIVALGGTTLAVAASGPGSSSGSTRIYACVTEEFRTLNLSSASARCPAGQRKISWSATGRKGDRGARGAAGRAGAAGAAGAQGAAGVAGAVGATGAQGAPGGAGAAGAAGADGAAGPQGPIGPMGLIGPQGVPGVIGPQGIQGLVGPQGIQGPAGAQGENGLPGQNGVQGETGSQGDVGPAGPQGPQGPQGETGEAGPEGAQGPIGPTGATGDAGPQGPAGAEGPAGPQGQTGPQGPVGPSGSEQVMQADLATTTVSGGAPRAAISGWASPSVETLDGFNAVTGMFTAQEAGTYRVAYDATAGPQSAASTSSGANTWFALTLAQNGTDVFERRFPVLDVNVPLVLTLRVPLREASVSAERYVTLAAGDVLQLDVSNGFLIPMNLAATLSITKVS